MTLEEILLQVAAEVERDGGHFVESGCLDVDDIVRLWFTGAELQRKTPATSIGSFHNQLTSMPGKTSRHHHHHHHHHHHQQEVNISLLKH